MPALARQKITLGEMRAAGVRGLLIYCSDYHCSDHRFTCQACGRRGADVRPDWQSAEA
jgi:hypothetical protein